jgi:hypothetical protein|tara:strand:- start:174 stop:605 length:432 start_codon:yes stop_codon:yes gene_type:complete
MDKGIDDISEIRKILKDYVEVELPYDFKKEEDIKYITLDKNTQTESFFNGGEYVKSGNELIYLQNGPINWSIKTKLRDDDNNIYYTSRIYVRDKIDIKNYNTKDILEFQKTIKAQQMVIEKMTKTIREDKIQIQKYENLLQKK